VERYRMAEGLVVGRKPLPGGDVILLFVGPQGAAQAIARKAQRPTGRSGRLSLFHHLRYQVYQKPGNELPTLTQVELVGRLMGLEAPERFPLACFLAELAYQTASPEAAPRVWPLLIAGLRGIAKHPRPQVPFLWSAWRVLKAVGLAPNLGGKGLYLWEGERCEGKGVYLGAEGMEVLTAVLRRPGAKAVQVLEAGPLERLQRALLAHVRYAVGDLRTTTLLAPQEGLRGGQE